MRLLLAAGANVNAVVKDTRETALHAALCGAGENVSPADRHTVVQLLVAHGADTNARTVPGVATLAFWRDVRTRGETPLHRAAAFAAEDTIQYLLAAGADKTIRDANGDSPQSWASWHWRSKRIVDLLDPQNKA